jgi:hypothetical protein
MPTHTSDAEDACGSARRTGRGGTKKVPNHIFLLKKALLNESKPPKKSEHNLLISYPKYEEQSIARRSA